MPATITTTRVREPGLLKLPPGTERYRIRGGGALALRLYGGDRITLRNKEGLQVCHLSAFSLNGQQDLAALGTSPDNVLLMLPEGDSEEDLRLMVQTLTQHQIDVLEANAKLLFGADSRSGDNETFSVARDVICVVSAPGKRMLPYEQDPPSELEIVVERSAPRVSGEEVLPPPLAEPRFDLRVNKTTAESYEVRAGEYIQIIDVSGRQCSDFLAFDSRRLQNGTERGLDATTTRTLMGNSYPQPGLYSKFFDQDMQPLVEVVRDTVGRHDTFALACTAKYYADRGYPRHANCSDNFNSVLSGYGVVPRAGWPAINFFYNTGIDRNNVLFLDEPWSRPGDYVLLRAMADLVCASSACPDDIDPANGWNPTDIHVRIYSDKHSFSKGIAHRMTPDADPQLSRETAFHARTAQLTRDFVEYRGFWIPNCYPQYGTIDEYVACREAAVIMDLSPLRKFEILGPDAEALLQATTTRNIRKLAVGQVVYTALCNESGGIIDDGTVFRLGDNNFRFVGAEDFDGIWLRQQAEKLEFRAWVKSSTDQLHNVAVQGPNSRNILKEIIWTAPVQPTIVELTWFRFTIGRLDHAQGVPVLVSRTGYTGELGYEIWCHPDDAATVWDRVWEVGQNFGLIPLGMAALDILRIESGLIFSGYEFDDQIDPFEAGIGFAVALNKEENFIGKDALIRRKEHPQRVLVGLELDGNEPAIHGDCVHDGRNQIGVVTSGTRSPLLGKNIALCRMSVQYSAIGTEVEVGKLDGHQKRIPARVVKFPFYDPEKKRPRS